MRQNEAQYTLVESLLHEHTIAVRHVQRLSRFPGPDWIHQQSCIALASTYTLALGKLNNMLTELMLSQHLLPEHHGHLHLQPALDMVLTAILQGKRFLQTCTPSAAISFSPRHHAVSSPSFRKLSPRLLSSASTDGEEGVVSSEFTTADGQAWVQRALLQGLATHAIEVHLHDFLIAFSAVDAAMEDLNAQHNPPITKGRVVQIFADQAPSPDLFWRDQNKPHVLIVSGLDYVKQQDDTLLDSRLENVINQRGYPNNVNMIDQQNTTITISAVDAAQMAIIVKDKMRCANQALEDKIDLHFLDINKLHLIAMIMNSYSTSVHKVTWLGGQFALKLFKEGMGEVFLQEAKIHFRLHHPNVVHTVALFKGEGEYGILIELMDESLGSFMKKHASKLSLQEKVGIMLQIAKGMAYVHEKGVIHRDLKPLNVLVRSSMDTDASGISQLEVKVADFGESLSRMPDSSSFRTKKRGTTVYRAPEVLNDDEGSSNFTASYKMSADVYSFAMTCFELLAEKEPFHDAARMQPLWEKVVKGERPDLSDTACPPYLKNCLQLWWADDPKRRHSFKHICRILRHLHICLARCQGDTQPMARFPFLAWPLWKWERAQDIAVERMKQFEMRRENDDWKHRGYFFESTRVNEIPYELHVMKWALKKAAEETDKATTEPYNRQNENVRTVAPPNLQSANHIGESSQSKLENSIGSTPLGFVPAPPNPSHKSFGRMLKEFCCFTASITPSNHEAFRDDIKRRSVI